LKRVGEMENGY